MPAISRRHNYLRGAVEKQAVKIEWHGRGGPIVGLSNRNKDGLRIGFLVGNDSSGAVRSDARSDDRRTADYQIYPRCLDVSDCGIAFGVFSFQFQKLLRLNNQRRGCV